MRSPMAACSQRWRRRPRRSCCAPWPTRARRRRSSEPWRAAGASKCRAKFRLPRSVRRAMRLAGTLVVMAVVGYVAVKVLFGVAGGVVGILLSLAWLALKVMLVVGLIYWLM